MRVLKYLVFANVICFVALCSANAASCTYKYNNYTYECNVTTNSLSCDFLYNNNLSKDAINTSNLNMTLSEDDFINSDGEVDCNEVRNLYFDQNINNRSIQIIYDIRSDNNNCPIHTQRYNARPGDFLTETNGCVTYSLSNSSNDDSNGNTSDEDGGFNPGSGAGTGSGNTGDGEFNTENFCSGSVQGVFTTIGWVFFIAKILIPIVLIIFGSIDFGRAIIANKDDEIKKGQQTFVKRLVAAVIVFLVVFVVQIVLGLVAPRGENSNVWSCFDCIVNGTSSDNCEPYSN